MVASFRNLFITFTLVGVFVLAMISFGSQLQKDNNADGSILDDQRINNTFIKLGGNLSKFNSTAQSQKDVYEVERPERGFGSLIIFSLVTVIQKFVTLVVGVFNILIILPAEILGLPNVVMGTLEAIFLISIIILGWRVLRVGS